MVTDVSGRSIGHVFKDQATDKGFFLDSLTLEKETDRFFFRNVGSQLLSSGVFDLKGIAFYYSYPVLSNIKQSRDTQALPNNLLGIEISERKLKNLLSWYSLG